MSGGGGGGGGGGRGGAPEGPDINLACWLFVVGNVKCVGRFIYSNTSLVCVERERERKSERDRQTDRQTGTQTEEERVGSYKFNKFLFVCLLLVLFCLLFLHKRQ